MTFDRKTRHMKLYDVIVIGAGDAGLGIVFQALGVKSITGCMHIFPALSNIIPETFSNLE